MNTRQTPHKHYYKVHSSELGTDRIKSPSYWEIVNLYIEFNLGIFETYTCINKSSMPYIIFLYEKASILPNSSSPIYWLYLLILQIFIFEIIVQMRSRKKSMNGNSVTIQYVLWTA